MTRQTCQRCGRRVGNKALMESTDPWDGKDKWVCIDADACVAATALPRPPFAPERSKGSE